MIFLWRVRAKIRKNREVPRSGFFSIFSIFSILADFGAQNPKIFDFFFLVPNGFLYGWGVFWGHFEVFWRCLVRFFGFSPLLAPFLKGFWIPNKYKISCFWSPKSVKIEKFWFFFWVENGFGGGLGVVWGIYKWILDNSDGLWGHFGQLMVKEELRKVTSDRF